MNTGKSSSRIVILWAALLVMALSGFWGLRFGKQQGQTDRFVVVTKHFGINSSEIERSITDTLENLVGDLPGIKNMESSSEFARSRLTIELNQGISPDSFYLVLRDRVYRAYSGWPISVQRPQIYFASGRQAPVFIAAFSAENLAALRDSIEKEVKPAIERLDGVGEVNIGGGGIQQIQVELDPDMSAHIGFTPGQVGRFLQRQHQRIPLGFLEEQNIETALILSGHLTDLNQIESLRFPAKDEQEMLLGAVSKASYAYRNAEYISRIDKGQAVSLYIHAAGQANLVQTSRLLRQKILGLQKQGYAVETVYDLGEQLEKSIRDVLFSCLIGMVSIAVFLGFMLPSLRGILHLITSIPLLGLLTLNTLSVLGIAIDQAILAGMAVGMGMMVDSALVITDSLDSGRWHFKSVAPPLMASMTTTLIVFLPLLQARHFQEDMPELLLSITILLIFSLAYYLIFLPGFLNGRGPVRLKTEMPMPGRLMLRCMLRPLPMLALSGTVAVAAMALTWLLPRTLEDNQEEGTLFARIEMESGRNMVSVDARTQTIVDRLRLQNPALQSIETRAGTGQSQLTIRFDPRQTDSVTLKENLETISAQIPETFAYVFAGEQSGQTKLEFTLTGADNHMLRDMARQIVSNAQPLDWVSGGILHFKDNPPSYVFVPSIENLEQFGLNLANIGALLKWSIQGPVALKWLEDGKEKDLRVFLTRHRLEGLNDLHSLAINSADEGQSLRLDQLGRWEESREISRITHVNRQRAVTFSLLTSEKNLSRLIDYSRAFIDSTALPRGYGLFYDDKLLEQRQQYRQLWQSLLIAFVLIYAVLAIQSGSFLDPFLELAIIPLTLFLPLVVYALLGRSMKASTMIGLVILSGMAVNNSILILSNYRSGSGMGMGRIFNAVKGRYRSLLLTTGTTLLGILPLVARAQKGTSFTVDVALVLALGLFGSFVACITLYPAFLRFAMPRGHNKDCESQERR